MNRDLVDIRNRSYGVRLELRVKGDYVESVVVSLLRDKL